MGSGRTLLLIAITALLAACASPKDVVYMQNAAEISEQQISNYHDVKIKPDDLLSIIVSSRTPQASAVFNLQSNDYRLDATGARIGQSKTMGYLVDKDGNIDFPVLGRLKVIGLTRSELSTMIKNKLADDGMLKDAVVTVQFQNFKISVLGEVKNPGKYSIETDRVSILDAIAMAGDMTIYGVRDSVMVLRESDGENKVMFANVLDKSLLSSPAFYLQQNDVVYVKPNKIKAQQSGINQNNNVGVWLSVASVLTSISVLIFK